MILLGGIFFPKSKIPDGKEVKHFTDLVRYFYCSSIQYNNGRATNHLYSATKLYGAGVMFRNDKECGLLDIQFKKLPLLEKIPCFNISWFLTCLPCLKCFPCLECMQTLLKFPTLTVDDSTEVHFRNLMALEQCHYPSESYICNYVVLLDCLIDTSADVELLVKEEIIANDLGSNEEVANMVNKLCHEIVEKNSCYADLAQDLYRHYNQGCNHHMASLRSIYFPNVWRGTTTIVGLIVFGFTFWNTIRPYAIK